MVSYTSNVNLAKPANSSYVGTWDVPVNNNSDIIDSALGTITTINPISGTTTLSTAQFQSYGLTFGSTLTGNVTIVFPVSQAKGFVVQHRATNSSLYTITLQTTASGGEAICCPPYAPTDILSDGTNLRFRNLDRAGTYWDYAASSVPIWVTGCTVPPYLNCDGTTFSSATYPALTTILGGTTLPDSRGRFRATLNQGQSRLTSTYGPDGNTILSGGGVQSVTIAAANLPAHSHAATDTSSGNGQNIIAPSSGNTTTAVVAGAGVNVYAANTYSYVITTVSNSTYANSAIATVPPGYIAGITMIRSA